MIDLLPFVAYVAGLLTGYLVWFKEDEEEEVWRKRRALGHHVTTNIHGERIA